MYINHEERKAKIGKISVSVSRDNLIKLRFTYPKGKRNDINISTNTDREQIVKKPQSIFWG
jgi:L-2-hydroxyglutarate oxidase LhgO